MKITQQFYTALMTNINTTVCCGTFSIQAERVVCKAFAESWLGKASCVIRDSLMKAQGC